MRHHMLIFCPLSFFVIRIFSVCNKNFNLLFEQYLNLNNEKNVHTPHPIIYCLICI